MKLVVAVLLVASGTCVVGKISQQNTELEVNNCETLEDIDNGSVKMTGVTPGSTATYNCNQDYQLKGPATRTCLADGTWSGTEPTCIVSMEKMCESLGMLGQQVLSTSNGGQCTLSSDCIDMRCAFVRNFGPVTNLLTTARIHLFPCAKPPAISYKVDSPKIGTIIDGTFNESRNISGVVGTTPYDIMIDIIQRPYGLSGTVRVKIFNRTVHITPPEDDGKIYMSCDCDCGHPGDIDHGTVDVSGGTMIGDTVTYQCDQHFQLNGEDTRTCQDDGTWSGTAPTCQVPVEDMCQSLMNMGTSLSTTSIGTFGECTVSSDCLSLRCLGLKLVVIPGVFAIDYNSSVTLLPCQAPYGMLLKATAGEVTIVNGVFVHNTILKLLDPTTNIGNIIIAEMVQKPFGVTTSSTAYVLNNKILFLPQTDVKMTCVCPTLPDLTHGTVTRPDVATVGSTTQYQCEPTHVLSGPSIRTCQADGIWSGVEPTCDSTLSTMCTTARRAIDAALAQDLISGQCNTSVDCLTIKCKVEIKLKLFITVRIKNFVTIRLLPCHMPFGIHVHIDAPQLGDPISGTFTETTTINRRLYSNLFQVIYEIQQTDHGLMFKVSIQFLGNTVILIPRSEIEMHCLCPALEEFTDETVELSNGYEVGSIATIKDSLPFEVNASFTRVCLPDGTWNGGESRCKVTREVMCASMNKVVNRTLQLEGISGSCKLSDNCTITECSLVAEFSPSPPQNLQTTVTYNPCKTPYSFHMIFQAPSVGVVVDEMVSESKMVEFKIGNTTNSIDFSIEQGYRRITMLARANILGKVIVITPRSTIYMYCDECTLNEKE